PRSTTLPATPLFGSGGGDVTGALGEKVYDTATVTASPFTATGTVVYQFFTTIDCTGSHTDETVTLTGSGAVPNSATTGMLVAGRHGQQTLQRPARPH